MFGFAFPNLAAGFTDSEVHAVVTPLAVSAGGGMFPEDDDRLPGGADRNGRHWLRVEFKSSEVSGCAYVAVVEAPTKWRVCSGHLTVALPRVVRSRVVSLPVLGTI